MQYIIMFLIVFGMAVADIITGIIKGYCLYGKPDSQKMRIGGLHKLSELTVMLVAIGLKIGLDSLGVYYGMEDTTLTDIAGSFTAIGVFSYIVIMEIISVLENYAAINPSAAWVQKYLKKFKPEIEALKAKEEKDDDKN